MSKGVLACVFMCALLVCSARGGQKRESDPLRLELHSSLSCPSFFLPLFCVVPWALEDLMQMSFSWSRTQQPLILIFWPALSLCSYHSCCKTKPLWPKPTASLTYWHEFNSLCSSLWHIMSIKKKQKQKQNNSIFPSKGYYLLSHQLLTRFTVRNITPLHKRDPKSYQKTAGYSHDSHASIVTVGISCLPR